MSIISPHYGNVNIMNADTRRIEQNRIEQTRIATLLSVRTYTRQCTSVLLFTIRLYNKHTYKYKYIKCPNV